MFDEQKALVELFKKIEYSPFPDMQSTANLANQFSDYALRHIVDELINGGVVVPPCKVGQTVWFVRNGKVEETKIEKIVLKEGGLYLKLSCNSMYETTSRRIGKTIFFNKKDAEDSLAV